MSCVAEIVFEAPAMAPDDGLARCGWVALDLAGRAGLALPDVGISRALTLPRAHAEGGLALGEVAVARVAVAAVRSGGDAGYIGVDGEALVPEVQIAEVRGAWTPFGLAVGAGLVADPWVASGDAAWGQRPIAATFGEAAGWMDSSDLGGWLGWSAPDRRVTARVDIASGEGARFRERNEGKDLAATVSVRPAGEGGAVFTVYGRDGSRGLGLARDHRLGVRASGSLGPVTGMVEGLAAWGVDGDALRQPLGGSASLVARPFGPLLAYVRLDLSTEAWGDSEAGTRTVLAGAGVELPDMDAPPLRLIAGYSGTRVGDGVAAIAGAYALQDADMVFLQVGVTLGVASTCSNPSCSPR